MKRFPCPAITVFALSARGIVSLVLGLMFKGDVSRENGTVFCFRGGKLLRGVIFINSRRSSKG